MRRRARNDLAWHRAVDSLRRQVVELRGLRADYRKQIVDIQRAVKALDKLLSRTPMYEDIRRGLSRAVLSLDGETPQTTSFLTQLDYLTGQYDRIRRANRVAYRCLLKQAAGFHLWKMARGAPRWQLQNDGRARFEAKIGEASVSLDIIRFKGDLTRWVAWIHWGTRSRDRVSFEGIERGWPNIKPAVKAIKEAMDDYLLPLQAIRRDVERLQSPVDVSAWRVASRWLEAGGLAGFHGWKMSPRSMRLEGPQFTDRRPIPMSDVEEAVEFLEEDAPGLLVAYSRGGAVAMMALRQVGSKPRVIYVAPAWRRGWARVSPPSVSGVILHGDEDSSVPLQHSCDLALQTGLPLRVVPDRDHVSILKDKTNPGAGIPVPRDKVRECAKELPDWGTSGRGSREDIAEQQAFTDSLVGRAASRY